MNSVSALRIFPFSVIDAFFLVHYRLFGAGVKGGSFFKMPACVSWAAGDRERAIVFLWELGLSKRRSRNWASGSGGCRINKTMDVQMDQVSPPL